MGNMGKECQSHAESIKEFIEKGEKMQELKESLEKFAGPFEAVVEENRRKKKLPESKESKELRDMATKWAKMCVNVHSGKLLEKGLKITLAISEYLNELEWGWLQKMEEEQS